MKKLLGLLSLIVMAVSFISCGNNGNRSKEPETYLSRSISYYSTPGSDAFGFAVKLNRDNKSYTLYENSFRNQEWNAVKSGNYSEKIENNIAICDLHIEPEHFGDVYEVRVYLNTDKAAFISISSEIDAQPCNPIQ